MGEEFLLSSTMGDSIQSISFLVPQVTDCTLLDMAVMDSRRRGRLRILR